MEKKILIILMGIPASGKSTFCMKYLPDFERINLDTLRSRHREEIAIKHAISSHKSIVIDNTNVTKLERSRYIELVKGEHYKIYGYFFQSIIRDCMARNANRKGRACVPDIAICDKSSKLEFPEYSEGFDKLIFVSITNNDFKITDWKTK